MTKSAALVSIGLSEKTGRARELSSKRGRMLVGSLLIIGLVLVGSASGSSFLDIRRRLGQLQHQGDKWTTIYESYFDKHLKLRDRALRDVDVNDWRRVRPTGEVCIEFLLSFQAKKHTIQRPFDILVLDACLDWMFNEEHETDRREDIEELALQHESDFKVLKFDRELRRIYQENGFRSRQIPEHLLDRLYGFIQRTLDINAQDPNSRCHGFWLKAYADFVEDIYLGDCEDELECDFFGLPNSDQDAYLSQVAGSVKQSAVSCFETVQKRMTKRMVEIYGDESGGPATLVKSLKLKSGRVAKQSESMRWGRNMIRVLQIATGQNPDLPVDLGEVAESLYQIKHEQVGAAESFLTAVGDYAIQNIELDKTADDPEGRKRFSEAVAKLCRNYKEDRRDHVTPNDVHLLTYSMVRLTNHYSVFGISKDMFEERVLQRDWTPLYLTAMTCQLMSITLAELDNHDGDAYEVNFRANAMVMVEDWPLDLLRERLPKVTAPPSPDHQFSSPGRLSDQFNVQASQPAQQSSHSRLSSLFKRPSKGKATTAKSAPTHHQQPQWQDEQPEEALPARPSPRVNVMPSGLRKNKIRAGETPQKAASAPPKPIIATTTANKLEFAKDDHQDGSQVPSIHFKMSEASINMFRRTKGRWPANLPRNIHEIYPNLPQDLSVDGKPYQYGPAVRMSEPIVAPPPHTETVGQVEPPRVQLQRPAERPATQPVRPAHLVFSPPAPVPQSSAPVMAPKTQELPKVNFMTF